VAFTARFWEATRRRLFNAPVGNLLVIVTRAVDSPLPVTTRPARCVVPPLAWQVAGAQRLAQVLQIWIGRWAADGDVARTRERRLASRPHYFVFSGILSRGFRRGRGSVAIAVHLCFALHGALVAIPFVST